MEVSALVQSITTTFQDAATLVNQIQDQRLKQPRRQDEDRRKSFLALEDLAESLELGPIVIRGYYASDVKRFGHPYLTGDDRAKEQLKNVLLNLQMSVLTSLRSVLIGDGKLDYAAIQAAADDCRVDAGVCLGQLSQRLAEPSRMQSAFNGRVSNVPFRLPTPPLKYSGSPMSIDSPRTPTTPEMEAALEFDYPGRLLGYNPHSSKLRGKASAVLQGQKSPASPHNLFDDPYNTMQPSIPKIASSPEKSHNRRPSTPYAPPYEPPHFFPVSPALSTGPWHNVSPVSSEASSTIAPPIKKKPVSSEYLVANRISPDHHNVQIPNQLMINTHRKIRSESSSIRSTGSTQIRQISPEFTPRFVQPIMHHENASSVYSSYTTASIRDNTPPHPALAPPRVPEPANAVISFVTESPIPPLPVKSTARNVPLRPELLREGAKKILGDVDPILDVFHGILSLPTESNLMGFCKSAQRLQSGNDKKAFTVAQRPLGYSGMMPYWRCEKCVFEGPMSTRSPTVNGEKRGKPEKIFDPAIREYDGIRFKWIFLAKCHASTKSTNSSSAKIDGNSGSFACIFCTAEGSIRNWDIADQGATTSIASSGKSKKDSVSGGSPIFGNSHSFMEHLQMHRRRQYWPNKEMQKRTKCVVGRVAAREEDFEINLMPLDGEA